jgi:hypothetical protein
MNKFQEEAYQSIAPESVESVKSPSLLISILHDLRRNEARIDVPDALRLSVLIYKLTKQEVQLD